MSAFGNQLAGALATLREATGVDSGVYRRGVQSGTLLNVGQGRSMFEVAVAFGVERFESHDWLIQADQLRLTGPGGSAAVDVTPEPGDTFTVLMNGQTFTYEVLLPNTGGSCWSYSDTGRSQIRVHTILVGVV